MKTSQPGFSRTLASCIMLLLCAGAAFGQEKKGAPKLTAATPPSLAPGAEARMKFRGLKLDGVTEVRLPALPGAKVELKEKKKADLPNGLEAKDVGDMQLEAVAAIPADAPPGRLAVELITPEAVLKHEFRVVAADSFAEEKEPNNGFRDAQPVPLDKTLRGRIEADKDVDVYSISAVKGRKLRIEILASRAGSMLDSLLTIYDERGQFIVSADDAEGRDPALIFIPPADGKYLISVQDTGDRGGAWHAYELTVKEAAK